MDMILRAPQGRSNLMFLFMFVNCCTMMLTTFQHLG
jgi:hypothetical protein